MVTGSPLGLAKAGRSLATAALAAWVLVVPAGAAAESRAAIVAWEDVVVRVYDTTGLARASRQRALAEAKAALTTASVDIVWLDCAEQGNACLRPPAPRDLIVRLVNGRAADRERVPLGDAVVDTGENTGVLATVYVDRVRRVSAALGTEEAVLLGRAIAHELGHLLTGSKAHARGGLMRGRWTAAELSRNRREDWVFATPVRRVPGRSAGPR